MKVTNKSELFKAAWKMFRANAKMTFSEALKIAWDYFKVYKINKARQEEYEKTERSAEDKLLTKALIWARFNVSETIADLNFSEWKAFFTEHKNEGTVWQLVAKFARIQDSILRSFY